MSRGERGFHARLIELPGGLTMVTLVDEEVLGVKVHDESTGVVIDVRREFYSGELIGGEEAVKLLEEADFLVLIGSRIIKMAVDQGIANPDAVLRIKGVEYMQIIKFQS